MTSIYASSGEIQMLRSTSADISRRPQNSALGFSIVPILLLALPLPPTKGKWAIHKQDWFLIASIVIALGSAVAYFVPNALFGRRSIWPLILLGTSLLLTANIEWNKAFRAYCDKHPEYRREDFRKAMVTTLHWPVYGRYDNAIAASIRRRIDTALRRCHSSF